MRHAIALLPMAAAGLALLATSAAAEPAATGFAIVTQSEDGAPIPRSAGLPYAP